NHGQRFFRQPDPINLPHRRLTAEHLKYDRVHVKMMMAVYMVNADARFFQSLELRNYFSLDLCCKARPGVVQSGSKRTSYEVALGIGNIRDSRVGQYRFAVAQSYMQPCRE